MTDLTLATELIAQQSDKFKIQLNAACAKLMQEGDPASAQKSAARKELTKLLNDQFNANFEFQVNTTWEPCCFPLIASIDNALLAGKNTFHKALFVGHFAKKTKAVKELRGGVDLKTGSLSGDYSKLPLQIFFSFRSMTNGYFKPEYVAAIIMHEVGHLILALEFAGRTFKASQLLAALHQVKTGRDSSIKFEDAITTVAARLDPKNPSRYEEVINSTKGEVTRTAVLSMVWSDMASDFGYSEAAVPNFERLADNFAARYGYTVELQEAFMLGMPGYQKAMAVAESRTGQMIDYVVYSAQLIFPIAAQSALAVAFVAATSAASTAGMAAAILSGAAFGAGIGIIMGAVLLTGAVSPMGEFPYDRFVWRMQRIREAAIEQLKQPDLPPMTRKALLDQIARMRELEGNKVDRKSIYHSLGMLFNANKRIEAAMQLERDLEKLTNNELFVSGNRLKTL